ncbi:MAG: phosphoenolpyruvate--protein phosphotransferase [Oscillospiraceae bacterium]|nr:phosphoenolpyruvate--protein phosphotransferase [Oscillospiraceae bacterium]
MTDYNGKSVFKGIAIGKITVYKRTSVSVKSYTVSDRYEELERFYCAKETAASQLDELYTLAINEVGGEDAAIFMIHMMMMEDFSFLSSIEHLISDGGFNAEYAVSVTGQSFFDMFQSMDDPYMQARSADVKDITTRLLDILGGIKEQKISSDEPAIVIADELSPSETVRLASGNIIAFATAGGSASSHTAILARSMKMPSVVGAPIEITPDLNGKTAVIDGYDGKIYIDPDERFIALMLRKQADEERKFALLLEFRGKENITADGRKIDIFANAGRMADIDDALENDAGGIGLFRSEFIYLSRDNFPTENDLFEVYKAAAEKMRGKEVVIRALDVGADRRMEYYGLPNERNPALGCRGIRYLLNRPDIFKAQLRAIYRAAAFGQVSVLYPMVSTVVDAGRIRKINDETVGELKAEGIPIGDVRQGILIETPSAVIISDLLARDADFLSIGTNDLAQYTMVMDRENSLMNDFFDPINISLFRMIKMVIDNAHRYKKRAAVCGEMAADLSLTKILVAMGIDQLSVVPSEILPLRKEVCGINIGEIGDETLQQLWT